MNRVVCLVFRNLKTNKKTNTLDFNLIHNFAPLIMKAFKARYNEVLRR